MAEQQARYPLDERALSSQTAGADRLAITHCRGMAFVQLMASAGQAGALAERLGIATEAGRATVLSDYTALPLAPGQWLLCAPSGRDGGFHRRIRALAEGLGHVSEQSHGRVLIRVEGPHAREVLRKECRLDLHSGAIAPGFAAHTVMADVGVTLHYVDERPTFDLILYPGYADSFWHWLAEAAAEFDPLLAERTAS